MSDLNGGKKGYARKTRKQKRIFKKKDFTSGDGMLTNVWGPAMWHYLHTISFNYPITPTSRDKKYYRQQILNLQHTLPCRYCRDNLKKNLAEMPLKECHLISRDTFSRYLYALHEKVNNMLGKKSGLTYCDVRERYEHFRARCFTDDKKKTLESLRRRQTRKLSKGKGTDRGKEKGCTTPLYGKKSRCILKIVPDSVKCQSMSVDKKCLKRRN
jgi:hypothetical protein